MSAVNLSQRPFPMKYIAEQRFRLAGQKKPHEGSRRHVSSLKQMQISRGEGAL